VVAAAPPGGFLYDGRRELVGRIVWGVEGAYIWGRGIGTVDL